MHIERCSQLERELAEIESEPATNSSNGSRTPLISGTSPFLKNGSHHRLRPFDTHCHPGIEAISTAHIRKIVTAAKTKSASSILRMPASQVAEAIRNSAW
jgi:hypothetical protein